MKYIIIFILISFSTIVKARDNYNWTIIIDGKVLLHSTGSIFVLDSLDDKKDSLRYYYYPGSIIVANGLMKIKNIDQYSIILMNIDYSIANKKNSFQVRLPIELFDTDYCLVYIRTKRGKMIDFDYLGCKESDFIYKITPSKEKSQWIFNYYAPND